MINRKLLFLSLRIWFLNKKVWWIKKLPFKKQYKSDYAFRHYFIHMKYAGQFKEMAFKHFWGKYALGVVFDTQNGLFISDPGDIEINNRLGTKGKYDPDKVRYLLSLIDGTSVVYILGTHIGTLLVPLAKKSGQVFGFEANPQTYIYLKHNLPLNELTNTTVYNLGVYDDFGSLPFYQNKANSGGSKFKPVTDDFVYNYDDPSVRMVETVPLDEFQLVKKMPLPDLMIVDIEGAEYAALKRASRVLSHSRYLYIEFVPHHLQKVANIDVTLFLSVITPFFSKMKVVGRNNQVYEGEGIYSVLSRFSRRGTCADLLFFK